MRLIVLGGLVLGTGVLGPCSKPDVGAAPASSTGASANAATTARPPASAPAQTAGPCSVVGSFKGHVTTGHGAGSSEVKAGSDGSFSVAVTLDANRATTTLAGTYTMSGNQITVVNTSGTASNGAKINACPGMKGVYTINWSADCKQMTWTKVSDSCPPRVEEANGVTLTRE